MKRISARKEKWIPMEILGVKGYFSDMRIFQATVPSWFNFYELADGDGNSSPCRYAAGILVNFYGTFISTGQLPAEDEYYREGCIQNGQWSFESSRCISFSDVLEEEKIVIEAADLYPMTIRNIKGYFCKSDIKKTSIPELYSIWYLTESDKSGKPDAYYKYDFIECNNDFMLKICGVFITREKMPTSAGDSRTGCINAEYEFLNWPVQKMKIHEIQKIQEADAENELFSPREDGKLKKCRICGKLFYGKQWANDEYLCSSNSCWNTNYWQEIVDKYYESGKEPIIISGLLYHDAGSQLKDADKSLGFGGRRFKIRMNSGRCFATNNLIFNGKIPLQFREKLPDTAEFV